MAIIAKDTSFKDVTNRCGPGAYFVVRAKAEATTEVSYDAVPYNGKLVAAKFCNGATAMSASHNYIVSTANASDSDAAMIAAYDMGTNTCDAYAVVDLTLSTTAANLQVTAGDTIETTLTVEGTVTDGTVLLYFEAVPDLTH